MGTEPDNRDKDRVAILGELRGEIMVFERLQIKELSQGGSLVETQFPLQLNSLHDLRLTLGDRSVVLRGRVAHCRISDVDQDVVTYQTGLEFVEPPAHAAEVIAGFLEELKSKRQDE